MTGIRRPLERGVVSSSLIRELYICVIYSTSMCAVVSFFFSVFFVIFGWFCSPLGKKNDSVKKEDALYNSDRNVQKKNPMAIIAPLILRGRSPPLQQPPPSRSPLQTPRG